MNAISLAHGNGGRLMRELIEDVFAHYLKNPYLDTQADATTLPWQHDEGDLVCTSDSFTVQPLIFPGGDIGSLAVHGTVNDLAVAGATPLYLSLNVIMEEGLKWDLLERIVQSLAKAAKDSNVLIVCGDTKVVPRGQGGGLYLTTTGIGVKPKDIRLGIDNIQDGDALLLSGPVGDHGVAVMLAREEFGLCGKVRSDSASVAPLTQAMLPFSGLRFMRDPTRGGLATVLHEIQHGTQLGIRIQQSKIPIHDPVQGFCDLLGYDPLYLACEGQVVAVIERSYAEQALKTWQSLAQGQRAALIGYISKQDQYIVLETSFGGERILEELEDDPLPRIC